MKGLTSPAYIAPETILEFPSTTKVDMWALGIILYQFFLNKLPFESTNNFNTMKLIAENEPAPFS